MTKAKLTPKELEVVRQSAEGFTEKQIAHNMNISKKTVEWHKWKFYRKTGCGCIADLCRFAMRAGLVSLFLALALFVRAGVPGPNGTFRIWFSWLAPTNQPPSQLTWRLYGTTNAALPTNQWTLIATIPFSNTVTVGNRMYYTNFVTPGTWFFTMTTSNNANFWAESFFSDAASTPPPPPVLNDLQLNP